MKTTVFLGALFVASFFTQVQARDWEIAGQLKEPSGMQFGESAALSRDGKTALVAAALEACAAGPSCGAVYVYVRDELVWRRQAKLSAADTGTDTQLGGLDYDDNTVALSGDGNTALVGTNPASLGTGAVYVFVRKGETWHEQQKLVAPGPGGGADGFGRSVALADDGNTAIVGDSSPFLGPWGREGAAYIFERVGNQWEDKARLTGSRTEYNSNRVSNFGRAVAISGDGATVLVGSPGFPTDLQEAYVFKKTPGSWAEQAILSPADKADSYFGSSVALSRSGDTALVGAVWSAVAYVFQADRKDGDWRQEAKLGSDISDRARIGFSVALDDTGHHAVLGDWWWGTAFLFYRLHNDNNAGTPGRIRWVPNLLLSTNGGYLGSSVAISGDATTILASYWFDPACTLEDGSTGRCAIVYVLHHE